MPRLVRIGKHLDPGHPEFLRMVALGTALVLLGSAGLAFAVFHALAVGLPGTHPLVIFDLSVSLAAAMTTTYVLYTRDVERGAIAVDLTCFIAVLVLVVTQHGGDFFELWAMLYPPLAFMLRGIRIGALHVTVFLLLLYAAALTGIGTWADGTLSTVTVSNLIGATLVLTGLIGVYEAARRHADGHLYRVRQQLEQMSIRDALTGAYNRRHFNEMLAHELARRTREGRHLVLLLIDTDHFKAYNDALGHPAGDVVLRRIAGALATLFRRAGDLVFRVGGEEFAVLSHVRNDTEAAACAESVRRAVEGLTLRDAAGIRRRVTASIGFDVFGADAALTPEDAYGRVDRALYRAKGAGRNCVFRATETG